MKSQKGILHNGFFKSSRQKCKVIQKMQINVHHFWTYSLHSAETKGLLCSLLSLMPIA